MHALLMGVLGWAMAGAIPRLLVGAGLALGTYAVLTPILENALTSVASSFGGLASEITALLWMAGTGEAINIIAGALVARVAVQSASVFVTRGGN